VVLLDDFVRKHKLGWVFTSPADIEFSPRRYVQPDVFVVSDVGQGRPRSWRDARPISLIAEVKSESTARADRLNKRTTYQSEGIPVYWIVDPDARLLELWTPEDERPAVVSDLLTWQPRENVPALEIKLQEFFSDALE
jgi:Uma2 family endonuclease